MKNTTELTVIDINRLQNENTFLSKLHIGAENLLESRSKAALKKVEKSFIRLLKTKLNSESDTDMLKCFCEYLRILNLTTCFLDEDLKDSEKKCSIAETLRLSNEKDAEFWKDQYKCLDGKMKILLNKGIHTNKEPKRQEPQKVRSNSNVILTICR